MDTITILPTRQEIEDKLRQVFTPEQTAGLMEVMDTYRQLEAQREADTSALKQGLAALTEEVRNLAIAQTRTEQQVKELVQAQARTEKRVEELAQAQARTEKRVEELAEAQAHTERRVEELAQAQARTEKRVEELAEAQARTEERLARLEAAVEKLIEAQVRFEQRMDRFEHRLDRVEIGLAAVRGSDLERKYHQRASAYLGRLLRRPKTLFLNEIDDVMYDQLEERLTPDEFEYLLNLDLLVAGRPKHQPEAPPVWLAVEVSVMVDCNDVERAQRRAAALRKAGYPAIPTVAGEAITVDAEQKAGEGNVLLVQDGRARFWEEALKAALTD